MFYTILTLLAVGGTPQVPVTIPNTDQVTAFVPPPAGARATLGIPIGTSKLEFFL